MTDPFAEFGLAPHPAVDLRDLDRRYRVRAAACHPDHAGGDAAEFARVSDAWRVLKTPSLRLRHLAALRGAVSGTAMPSELFQAVADALAVASAACRPASSSVARAVRDLDAASAAERLRGVRARIAGEAEDILARLGAGWPDVRGADLADAAAALAYGERWDAQLAEAEHALAAR